MQQAAVYRLLSLYEGAEKPLLPPADDWNFLLVLLQHHINAAVGVSGQLTPQQSLIKVFLYFSYTKEMKTCLQLCCSVSEQQNCSL